MHTTHLPRLNYYAAAPELYGQLTKLAQAVHHAGLEQVLWALVEIRASQINGCAFCLDMHSKQAKLLGERELRLYALPAWRESTLFTERERAALAYTEAVTRLGEAGVSNEVFAALKEQFNESEMAQLTLGIALINAFNRIAITFRAVPGSLDKQFGLDKANLY